MYQMLMAATLANRGYSILLLGQAGAVPLLLLILNFLLINDLMLNAVGFLVLSGILGGLIYVMYYFLSGKATK